MPGARDLSAAIAERCDPEVEREMRKSVPHDIRQKLPASSNRRIGCGLCQVPVGIAPSRCWNLQHAPQQSFIGPGTEQDSAVFALQPEHQTMPVRAFLFRR